MIKVLFLALMLSSCSVFEAAQTAITTSREWGRLEGRAAVLEELAKNKKKLNELKRIVAHQLLDLGLEDEKEVMTVVPGLMSVAQLLRDRKDLKKHLENVTTSESVSDGP